MSGADVHLIFPAFTNQVDRAAARYHDIWKWVKGSWQPVAAEHGWQLRLHVGIPPPDALQRATYRKTDNGTMEMVYDSYDLQPKGKWVRDAFDSIKERMAAGGYTRSVYVVHVDGSGKIDFDAAIAVTRALDDGHQMLLGLREDPSVTMAIDRVAIERFENFLLEEKYRIKLKDAQCGCWGFRGDCLMKLPLSAQSYDIELDLVIGALESRITFEYVPVELHPDLTPSGVKQTDYRPENDIKKMQFLLARIGSRVEMLLPMISAFEKQTGITLPDAYKAQIAKMESPADVRSFSAPSIVPPTAKKAD